jgi:DNA-binding transcriptional LysR family regulator
MDLDLGAVRAFLAVVDEGQFTVAADQLGMTQQAVSKRIAKLESALGVPLLNRARTGARATEDGAAFLPNARALIGLADQSAAMLRARRRPLRIDLLARNAKPVDIVREFYEGAGVDVDILISRGSVAPGTALADGSLDAAFGRAAWTRAPGIRSVPAGLEPLPVLVGHRHPLAQAKAEGAVVRMAELSGLTAWMPGNSGDSEWAEYYRFLSAEFGVRIDSSGPVFSGEHMMERIAASTDLFMFAGRRQFPALPDIVQLAVVDPTPVYPWSLMWHEANRHPSLPLLIAHVKAGYRPADGRSVWLPAADRPHFPAMPEPVA